MTSRRAAGVTLLEIAFSIIVVSVVLVAAIVAAPRNTAQARMKKDAENLRSILLALIVFGNDGRYPLPSTLDSANATVPELGRTKDTSGNVFSLMAYMGFVTPEQLVSPHERNLRIIVKSDYAFAAPKAAQMPANALWDPAFNADFTRAGVPGNLSYASLQLSNDRLSRWADTYDSSDAVVGSRSPQIGGVTLDRDGGYVIKLAGAFSNTLGVSGKPDTWRGNVAFNDGRVEQVRDLAPSSKGLAVDWPTFEAAGSRRLDVFYYDEPEDQRFRNIYMGIFTTAGEQPRDFRAIWD